MPNITTIAPGAVAQSVATTAAQVPGPATTGQAKNDNNLTAAEQTQAAGALSSKFGIRMSPTDIPGTMSGVVSLVKNTFQNASAAAKTAFSDVEKIPEMIGQDIHQWAGQVKNFLGIGSDDAGQESAPAKQANADGSTDVMRF